VVNPQMVLLTAPTGSAATATAGTSSANETYDGTVLSTGSGDSITSSSGAPFGLSETPTQYKTAVYAGFSFKPDKVGTYSFLVFDDKNGDGSVGSSETSIVYTIVVSDTIASITTSMVIDNASTKQTAKGGVLKVSLKDANGNATAPSYESIVLTSTGSAKFKYSYVQGAATAVSGAGTNVAYLTNADFDASGNAYIGMYDGTAEQVSVTPSIVGSLTTPTSTGTTATFATPTDYFSAVAATASQYTTVAGTPWASGTAGAYNVYGGAAPAITFTGATGATGTAEIFITDTSGKLYGNKYIAGSTVVTTGSTGKYSWTGAGTTSVNTTFSLQAAAAASSAAPGDTTNTVVYLVATSKASSTSTTYVTVTPSAATLAVGGTATLTLNLKDDYNVARSGIAVSAAITGRNAAVSVASAITDSLGNATFSYKDASTSTTSYLDTVTFTYSTGLGATTTKTATVNWVSGLVASAVTVTTSDTTKGVANGYTSPAAISTSYAGAQAGKTAIYAYVTTSSGAVAGVPVTFSVAGTGAAILSTYVTVYTDSTGKATSYIYGWKTGTYTVTATSGAVSGTGVQAFADTGTPAQVRSIAATASGNAVTATVTDRFGNPVKGAVTIYATIPSTSGAYFANSSRSTSCTSTDVNGTCTFIVLGADATVTVTTVDPNGSGAAVDETKDAAGYQGGTAVTGTALTATTVGTSATAETGVGASYNAAGVSSATATTTAVADAAKVSAAAAATNAAQSQAAIDAAQAATDAANEATDAANAATDAANNAMDSADAAQQAALDAGDKADAALAAVTDLASKVSDIASSISALSALVAKISASVAKISAKVKA
jgi:trimeric autotransporter adhesin